MKTPIDSRFVQVNIGNIELSYDVLTRDITKDFKIIIYYLAEQLPNNVPFDLGNWEILEYDESTILVQSGERLWSISLDNIYTYDETLFIDYRFFVIRE